MIAQCTAVPSAFKPIKIELTINTPAELDMITTMADNLIAAEISHVYSYRARALLCTLCETIGAVIRK
jgi:hypothetical protein